MNTQQWQRLRESASDALERKTVRAVALRINGMEDGLAGSPVVFGDQLQEERFLLHEPSGLDSDV